MSKTLEIIPATVEMLEEIERVLQETIKTSYSTCYNENIVDYFSTFHDKKHTLGRIESGNYFVLIEDKKIIGTGDFDENHIYAVYILPEYQSLGVGSFMMNFLENEISKKFDSVILEASIPALEFYKNRGYKFVKSENVDLKNGSSFSYDVMKLDLKIKKFRNKT